MKRQQNDYHNTIIFLKLNSSYVFLEEVIRDSQENTTIEEVKVLDLYDVGFNPILVFNKQKRRRDMHSDPDFAGYREQLMWADKIVFIYPIWLSVIMAK